VARGRPAGSPAGGGEEIQAPRPLGARLATAACALLVAVALAAPALGTGPLHGSAVAGLGAGALLFICAGLALRRSAPLVAGFVLLGAEQAVRLTGGPAHADGWTPLYAAGFLLSAELAWWSIEPRVPAFSELRVLVNRVAVVAGCCAGGALLAALVVLAAGVPLEGGVALELVGVLAAAAAVAVVAVVARSSVR
jgi:hypothetical protein